MPKPRKSVRQLAEMIKDPRRALSDPAFWNEPVCRRWLHHVGVVHLSDPSKAVPLAILGVRLALRVVRRQERRGLRNRARLQWAKALLYVPNRRRKARARKLLNDARRTFVRLGMKDEAVAVLAELTRINPAGSVPKICGEVLAVLGEGPIRDLVEKLRTVRMVRRVDVADLLRAAIRGPGVLPAAIWPDP